MRPELLTGLFDDAAVFPPGNLPAAEAIIAHQGHRNAWYADLVGPLVLAPEQLTVADLPDDVALVTTIGDSLPTGARFAALELRIPKGMDLEEALTAVEVPEGVAVYVEIPRDERAGEVTRRLADTSYLAKLRTGGPSAEHFPSDDELARSLVALADVGLAFKATAGLHHAMRTSHPDQHGFLNLLLAADAATRGASDGEVARLLGERSSEVVSRAAGNLAPQVRSFFRSFGTCSITEPLTDLARLGLLDEPVGVGR